MANESMEKKPSEQQLDIALRPFRYLLEGVSPEDLIKFNTIIETFPDLTEVTSSLVSKMNSIFSPIIYGLAYKLAIYLLRHVPDDPLLSKDQIDDYISEIVKELYYEKTYDFKFTPREEAVRLVAKRWPNVNRSIRNILEKLVSGFGVLLSGKMKGSNQYPDLIKIVAGHNRENDLLAAGFDLLYQDIIQTRELAQYLPVDVAKLINRY